MKNIARGTSRRDARVSLVQFCIIRNLHDYIKHASVAKHRIGSPLRSAFTVELSITAARRIRESSFDVVTLLARYSAPTRNRNRVASTGFSLSSHALSSIDFLRCSTFPDTVGF